MTHIHGIVCSDLEQAEQLRTCQAISAKSQHPTRLTGTESTKCPHPFCSDLELAEQLRTRQALKGTKAEGGPADIPSSVVDWSLLRVGGMASCLVSEHAPYGIVVDLDANEVCFRAKTHGLGYQRGVASVLMPYLQMHACVERLNKVNVGCRCCIVQIGVAALCHQLNLR